MSLHNVAFVDEDQEQQLAKTVHKRCLVEDIVGDDAVAKRQRAWQQTQKQPHK